MTEREQRGLEIAARLRLTHTGSRWRVPSQSSGTIYDVDMGADKPRCTCPDWELRRDHCKHIFAVLFVIQREGITTEPQAQPEPEPEPEEPKPVRPTYSQNWPAYNAAQRNEKWEFMRLLSDLCQTVKPIPQKPGAGQPRLPLADLVFAAALKVYSVKSGRRFMGDLDVAHEHGYLSRVPHFNSVFNCIEADTLTPVLERLIGQSAGPLAMVETTFGPDSSGFSTSRFDRWYDEKYGRQRSQQIWVKAHILVGVKTNIVAAVKVTDRDANDYPQMAGLLTAASERFTITQVPADKAYLGQSNFEAITRMGAQPYIPFKSNTTGQGSDLWERLYGYFMYNRADFLQHYHQRSNVETAFSMIKAKFGDALRSKSDAGLVNEMLLKVLCHNLCVLIQEMYELGIDPAFGAADSPASAAAGLALRMPTATPPPRLRLVPAAR